MADKKSGANLWDIFLQFLIIGAISFGGGIIAYERILLVEKRKWLNADEFMAYLAISQTMPGLNSVNLAVLTGDFLRGVTGSVCAVLGLLLPGSAFILGIGILYSSNSNHPMANIILAGIAAAATGLLAAITYRIGGDHWRHMKSLAIVLATFVLMSLFKLSLLAVLAIMAPIALYVYRPGKSI
ncbi:chromate transporter [Polynucleobacter sphagniphilus]|jgi:chromate transporter|uniref:Chromate transporter n=1 Tax=Polynucleobacter sphagniphilus TaxID=1743169 RepID=A0AA43MAC2_9BURK|nr:chromate transporter [Polynucleobacter sphagniphilus]MDF9787156.1 chromate transporter [Polynucleobacter sphagniphilus]MDH6240745.1 chromate transporter [Polynucleobacter sphagniphilus]MDH6249830.1 chromate transporter [Polynucleobacter sphagniphilus]MDH6420484.1 chromate transporter [Polynucleobacter sphagniphilus]MDH6504650.1 chromate transporter [Polynucleobacter sphagniphilus]